MVVKKGSNIRFRLPAAMPGPVVPDLKAADHRLDLDPVGVMRLCVSRQMTQDNQHRIP